MCTFFHFFRDPVSVSDTSTKVNSHQCVVEGVRLGVSINDQPLLTDRDTKNPLGQSLAIVQSLNTISHRMITDAP